MSLPGGVAFPRRHDCVASRGANLGCPSARDHADVGVPADHRNAGNLGNIERELRVLISEQYDALFRDLLRDFETGFHIYHALLRGIINNTARKHRPQYAVNMLIQLSLWNL